MMFSRRRSFRRRKSSGPPGERAYVVGDIHGRLDLLEQLLSMIEADVVGRRKSKIIVVFLGDLIDRGPASAQVVERLRLYTPEFGKTAFIMGNHEEILLRIIGGEAPLLAQWLRFGGVQCLSSYGLEAEILNGMPPEQAVEVVKAVIPPAHVEFFESFADSISFGSYLFVHAGIRPGVDLAEQRQVDLRWIRDPFLRDVTDHGYTVVHGHTITDQVEVYASRIGVDTGAYRSGVLTALAIEQGNTWILQTGHDKI